MRQPSGHGWESADVPLRPVLFVNPSSGGGKAARAGVTDRARERGIEIVVLTTDRDLATLVREAVARGADALGVAGGDGSLATVAAAASAHGLPFACVPVGTRNHFARDLGIDRHDPVGALDAFTDGVERRIDVGDVNGRAFLNNVTLGIYGDAVRRPSYRGAKVRTLLETADEVLGPSGAVTETHLVGPRGRTAGERRRLRTAHPVPRGGDAAGRRTCSRCPGNPAPARRTDRKGVAPSPGPRRSPRQLPCSVLAPREPASRARHRRGMSRTSEK